MKSLLVSIAAAVLLVGCVKLQPPDISIHEAAWTGKINVVKQHLAARADVNANEKSLSGWTLLHSAALSGHREAVELLIAKGADVNAISRNGGAVLDWADGETAVHLRKHGGKTGEELKAVGK